jgi:hypothetical protein
VSRSPVTSTRAPTLLTSFEPWPRLQRLIVNRQPYEEAKMSQLYIPVANEVDIFHLDINKRLIDMLFGNGEIDQFIDDDDSA